MKFRIEGNYAWIHGDAYCQCIWVADLPLWAYQRGLRIEGSELLTPQQIDAMRGVIGLPPVKKDETPKEVPPTYLNMTKQYGEMRIKRP